MMESINAFFNGRKEPPSLTTLRSTRNTSDATETTMVDKTNDISTEEKDIGVNPVIFECSSGKTLLHHRSASSTPAPHTGKATLSEKKNPFAGGVEGGVTYQSMKWWYVIIFAPEEHLFLPFSGKLPLDWLQKQSR